MLRRALYGSLIGINAALAGYSHARGDNEVAIVYAAIAVIWAGLFFSTHDGIRAAVAKVSPWK